MAKKLFVESNARPVIHREWAAISRNSSQLDNLYTLICPEMKVPISVVSSLKTRDVQYSDCLGSVGRILTPSHMHISVYQYISNDGCVL